ncbi:GAF domain-containing sensor histidine kinase [Herbidospora cretacea]|uniref:GAF domain-containing sensor histidine kinase n=1 Tax=Herbidospora cretacea TaxID=28444 RepID=UPI0004C450B3|nr:GAF domain-containing protein [Herbidospora cretacea]
MAHPLVPSMRLDELLAELQTRLEAVLATRDRVHSLLEAVVLIGSDLQLETVLGRIVETAARLVDATYGALGVVGEESTLLEFIPVGLSEEEIARIEHWPHGLGLLGLLIKEPKPLRLARISDHPDSYGFPPGHPPMGSFLGVPLRVRDEVFGNLYLTEKRGGAEFDEEDQAVVTALATAAGVAIENARLFEETRRREMWLQASSEVTTSLLSGAGPHEVLTHVVGRAREMADADVAVLRFGDGTEIVDGDLADLVDQASIPLGRVGSERAVLQLGKRPGRLPFTPSLLRMLSAFADQASIALELAEAREDAERLGLLEDRHRIAKDLHDVVIQRLFATAMTLMSTVKLVEHPEAATRVRHTIDELDETIRQIRSTIFALQSPAVMGEQSLRSHIVELVEGARGHLGFMPGLRMDGRLDNAVGDAVAEQLLAVLREALSNLVRHAKATRAEVVAEVTEGVLTLIVQDDGVGITDGGRRSGLRNLEERAVLLGGSFAIGAADGWRTRLRWSVPVS